MPDPHARSCNAASEREWVYPDVERLLRRARQASGRLWNGQRDDGAAQVIDELVARLEEASDA